MAEDKKKDEIAVIEINEEFMKQKLYEFRGCKVLLDADLAEVYMQLAKGAIAAGIEVLFKEYGCTPCNIDVLTFAGGFGNYIDKASAPFGFFADLQSSITLRQSR